MYRNNNKFVKVQHLLLKCAPFKKITKIPLNCLMQCNHNNSMLCYRRLHGRVMVKLCIFNRTTNGGCGPGLWCKIREYYNQTTKL